MKTFYVYILKCSDHTYYTSITSNLSQRLREHQLGKRKDTQFRRPIQLEFSEEFTDISLAISTEIELKEWSSSQKEIFIHKGTPAFPKREKRQLALAI